MEQNVPVVSTSGSMATPCIPQNVFDGPMEGPMLTGRVQTERRVLFGSVFDASSGTSGNGGTIGATGTQTVQAQVQ